MKFEVYEKKDNTVSYIDGVVNRFPHQLYKDESFIKWRCSLLTIREKCFENDQFKVTCL